VLSKRNSFITTLIVALLQISVFYIITQQFELSDVGYYSFFLSIVAFLGFISDFGFGVICVRRWGNEGESKIITAIIIIKACVFLFFLLFSIFYYCYSTSEVTEIGYYSVLLAFLGASLSTVWLNQANESFHIVLFIDSAVKVLTQLLVVLILFYSFNIEVVIFLTALGIFLSSLCVALFNWKIIRKNFRFQFFSISYAKDLLYDAAKIFLLRLMVRGNDFLVPYFIVSQFGLATLGIFSVLDRFIKPIVNMQQPIINVFSKKLYNASGVSLTSKIFFIWNMAVSVFVSMLILYFFFDLFSFFSVELPANSPYLRILMPLYLFIYLMAISTSNFIVLPSRMEIFSSGVLLIKLILLFLVISISKLTNHFEYFLAVLIILDILYIALMLIRKYIKTKKSLAI
jgi:O-antigen/teichoic acid export membrane protein